MGKVLEFKRPDPKRNWRKPAVSEYKLTADSPELTPQPNIPAGYVMTHNPRVFEQVREAIGSRNQYSAFLEILTKRPQKVRATTIGSDISWLFSPGEDEPTATLVMAYDTGHEVTFNFHGGHERRKGGIPMLNKTPVIDVQPDIWVKVDPYLILTLQDHLASMNNISPIILLQDRTTLNYSVIFDGYTKGRINVTIRKK